MKILTTNINPISHLGTAFRAHLKILDVVFFSKHGLNIYVDIISMKYLLKMAQKLKNQTLFYFYLGILLLCIPKIFLCKYENQNKPNGASPPTPSLDST